MKKVIKWRKSDFSGFIFKKLTFEIFNKFLQSVKFIFVLLNFKELREKSFETFDIRLFFMCTKIYNNPLLNRSVKEFNSDKKKILKTF